VIAQSVQRLGYGPDDRGSRVRFSAGAGNFYLHHRVQTRSGAHPASYPMGTRGSFPGGKVAGAWSWPLTSIYFRGQRMRGAIFLLSQYAFMAWYLVKRSTGTSPRSPLTKITLVKGIKWNRIRDHDVKERESESQWKCSYVSSQTERHV
jgi:hypothetical protein